MKKSFLLIAFLLGTLSVWSRQQDSLCYRIEASALASGGDAAPLWLTANRFGAVSTKENQALFRAGLSYQKKLPRHWNIGAGVDLITGARLVSHAWLQQAYADVSWKWLNLSVGKKERLGFPLEKNALLSSGWMVEGMNARPVPQVRAEIKEYLDVPGTKHWLAVKGHLAYGWFEDGKWQEEFIREQATCVKDILYHSKSLMIRIGNRKRFPVEFELGILSLAQFGGKVYKKQPDGSLKLTGSYPHGFKEYLGVIIPKQKSTVENIEGNHLGSWNFALNGYWGDWRLRTYLEHYFEDHSQMFWQYGSWKDGLLGVDVRVPKNRWVSSVVWECMATKNQTGPILYDGVGGSFTDLQFSGCDGYYNHGIYQSWQNYGMGMGNPLLPGPIYNAEGSLSFRSNRVRSHHLGISGHPLAEWNWRVLASFTRHWGTYRIPLDKERKQFSSLVEVNYLPNWMKGWSASVAVAFDRGNYLGNQSGIQLTVCKKGGFGL